MDRAGAEKLGVERAAGTAERKLGDGCEKLGAGREGCEKLGVERAAGAEKVGAAERYEGAGCGDRTCGCCCAKPELGGVR
jgi:hypothetical protein